MCCCTEPAGYCCRSHVPLPTTYRWRCNGVSTGQDDWWPRGSDCSSRLTLAEASVLLIPALAVDRAGVRLGRGRGFYDRTLVHRDPRTRLIAVIRDEELLDELPCEPHDVPMTHALTPQRGLIELRGCAG
jgi:5-formyltetrahydrofolate cyclo-ligase